MRIGMIIGFAALVGGANLANAEVDAKIERTWKAKCGSCHGDDGKGATEQGKKAGIGDLAATKSTDAQLKEAIAKGLKREKDGKKQEMDGYAEKLKPEQIDGLVAKIRSFKK